MVALNKPSAGDTSWATPVNDNWTEIENSVNQSICQGRLTLLSGIIASYDPSPKSPSSTDTAADTLDFSSAHGWSTGTSVSPESTGGGLTSGTIYYVRAVDSDTVSLHSTVADAYSGASKVNLTASITSEIQSFGIASTTLYFTPYKGNRIGLYSGSTWGIRSFSEISLALSTLTSGKNYDVFVYDNSGTPALELSAAWSDDTTRTDALTIQDGIRVKSSDATRRYVGTIRATASDSTEDGRTKRFVLNYYNRFPEKLFACPAYNNNNAETTYSGGASSSFAAANSGVGNRIEFLSNGEDEVTFGLVAQAYASSATGVQFGISDNGSATGVKWEAQGTASSSSRSQLSVEAAQVFTEGYAKLDLFVANSNSATMTIVADNARAGASQDPYATWVYARILG